MILRCGFSSSEGVFVKEALSDTSFDNDVFEQWRVQMLEGIGESKTLKKTLVAIRVEEVTWKR